MTTEPCPACKSDKVRFTGEMISEEGVSFPAIFSTCTQCRGSWYSRAQFQAMLAAKQAALALKEAADA